jgi:hypothetical protein
VVGGERGWRRTAWLPWCGERLGVLYVIDVIESE